MKLVLIHGAWQGRWAWDALLPHLAEAGFDPHAIDLPANGSDRTPPGEVSLEAYVAHLVRLIGNDRVGLVAHSGGGIVASQLAETIPERVCCIVYVAGMMLPDRMSYADLIGPLAAERPEAAGIGPHLIWSDDRLTSRVPAHAAKHYFFHDCPPDVAEWAAGRITPQPERGRNIRPRLSVERFGRIPRLYVEAENDRSVVLQAQRRMQALVPGAEVRTLPTGHVPQAAAPAELAACIVPWLRAHAAGPLKRSAVA